MDMRLPELPIESVMASEAWPSQYVTKKLPRTL
jgi:hypothetical protein